MTTTDPARIPSPSPALPVRWLGAALFALVAATTVPPALAADQPGSAGVTAFIGQGWG